MVPEGCTHPVLVYGKCLDCGAVVDCGIAVNGENSANDGVEPQVEQTPEEATTPPENGQKTPKKTTRKRKA